MRPVSQSGYSPASGKTLRLIESAELKGSFGTKTVGTRPDLNFVTQDGFRKPSLTSVSYVKRWNIQYYDADELVLFYSNSRAYALEEVVTLIISN